MMESSVIYDTLFMFKNNILERLLKEKQVHLDLSITIVYKTKGIGT